MNPCDKRLRRFQGVAIERLLVLCQSWAGLVRADLREVEGIALASLYTSSSVGLIGQVLPRV